MRFSAIIAVVASFLLTACETVEDTMVFWKEDVDEQVAEAQKEEDPTAEEFYRRALVELEERNYRKAIESFEEIERLYPFSKLATKAQVMVAYTYYKDEEYDDAIIVIDRYLRLHPGHKDVAYMYYLKALSYYDRIADVKRDQKVTQLALAALKEVVTRYPDTDYGRDAKLKIDLVYDHLAGKEMEIGRFYLRGKQYIAAVNRFQAVVKQYETTNHIAEALYRLTETYLLLGVPEEAKRYAAVLGHNYPNSKWYKYAYRLVGEGADSPVPASDPSWFEKMIDLTDDEETEPQELPTENEADNWFDKIKNVF